MREYTLQEKVRDWLFMRPGNIVWQDSFFYEQLIQEYGREAVEKERKRLEKEHG